jgi:hypothetical protein
MKKLLLLLACTAHGLFAAGTVTWSTVPLGQSQGYVITVNWTGDASTGSVPTTTLGGINLDGYAITQIQLSPSTPAPTAGYAVTIKNFQGFDMLEGQASSLSATASASYGTSSAVPPINGALVFALTGNSVASAKGSVLIFAYKPAVLAAANLLGRYGSGGGGAVNSVFGRTGVVVAANGDYTAAKVTNVPAGNISSTDVQGAINELDAEKQATGNYITALTGDVTATGPGSAAATLATVNANTGSCGDATHVCQVTLNAKGLATSATAVPITSSSGTVTVVGGGALTSTACATGGGTTTIQTPSANCTINSSGDIATSGTFSSGVGGGIAGAADLHAGTAPAVGSNIFGWGAPTTMTTSVRLVSPNAVPAANQVMLFGAPSSNISTWTWTGISGTGSFCMTVGSACTSSHLIHVPMLGCDAGGNGRAMINYIAGGIAFTGCPASSGLPSFIGMGNGGTDAFEYNILLPSTWAGNVTVTYSYYASSNITGTPTFQTAVGCVANGGASGISYNAATTTNLGAAGTITADTAYLTTTAALTTTGCAAGSLMSFQVTRNDTNTGTVRLRSMDISITY